MDLLQTVRKEGSRGGRADFKWEDVKTDAHRENYLGHSLMAPVGRWQRGKDLSWYAKGGDGTDQPTEEEIRKAELKKVKEAEKLAMANALGYELPSAEEGNANFTEIGQRSSGPGQIPPSDLHDRKRSNKGRTSTHSQSQSDERGRVHGRKHRHRRDRSRSPDRRKDDSTDYHRGRRRSSRDTNRYGEFRSRSRSPERRSTKDTRPTNPRQLADNEFKEEGYGSRRPHRRRDSRSRSPRYERDRQRRDRRPRSPHHRGDRRENRRSRSHS